MVAKNSRILILKGTGLSQFVEAEPAFSAIRAAHAGQPVDLLTTHEFGRLAKGAPYFDRVLAVGQFKDKEAKKTFLTQLKRQGYSRIYDLDGTPISQEIRRALTGWRGAQWIGPRRVIKQTRDGLSLAPSFAPSQMRSILADASIEVPQRLPDLSWALKGRKDAANMKPSWYGITGRYALLLPSRDPDQRWPAEHYAEVASELVRRGISPVLVGNADMKTFGNEVSQLMVRNGPEGGARALVDLTDKTDLAQLAALAKDAAFFVSGVTEELHLILSLGCPGVLLVSRQDYQQADILYGHRIVNLVGTEVPQIEPESAVMMLKAMGLLPRGENTPKEARFA
ncbi:heptosyltransferase [Aquisalinus flavus]|uniref:Heptosyltransferase n=1 Tax=Aquisalinus flavus TaxID=1526572 RepID=A0A8J2V6W6_9PROT|nr:glycosyltransferase family 9 protein [Aquisalinus flavus]MBD0428023.1 glycosyltransferase family 9 protein [Aquisalinus flavus]GGD19320.1 heptosyltransferase [Aquisalinus flavus]